MKTRGSESEKAWQREFWAEIFRAAKHQRICFKRMQVAQLRKFAWHKREWKALDVFRHNETGLASFNPDLRDDPKFKFVPGGWPKDWCVICNWEFNDKPEHSVGYTNGRQRICPKCYDAFLGPAAEPESKSK